MLLDARSDVSSSCKGRVWLVLLLSCMLDVCFRALSFLTAGRHATIAIGMLIPQACRYLALAALDLFFTSGEVLVPFCRNGEMGCGEDIPRRHGETIFSMFGYGAKSGAIANKSGLVF